MVKRLFSSPRRTLLLVVLLAAAYLLVGTMAPFLFRTPLSGGSAAGIRQLEFRSSSPVDGPDRALLLSTSLSAWEERLRMVEQARERIILSTFDIRDDASTRDLMSVLLEKADQGVDIKLLVDGVSGFLQVRGTALFQAFASHPRVELKIYNPITLLRPWRLQGRMHDKYLIVDDFGLILGGRNTFDLFLGEYPTDHPNLDLDVLIYNTEPGNASSAVAQVEDYFEAVWQLDCCQLYADDPGFGESTEAVQLRQELALRYESLQRDRPDLFRLPDYAAMTCPTRKTLLLSGDTGIGQKEPRVFYALCALMGQAEESVVLHTPYAVLNGPMTEALTQIAAAVPDSRLLLNARANGGNVAASSDYTYHRRQVLDTGFTLYEFEGGQSYHGKAVAVDSDLAAVGSYNLDLRSTYVDTELMLVIHSPEFNQQLRDWMTELEGQSAHITAAGETVRPEGRAAMELGLPRQVLYHVLGIVLQPFRVLV